MGGRSSPPRPGRAGPGRPRLPGSPGARPAPAPPPGPRRPGSPLRPARHAPHAVLPPPPTVQPPSSCTPSARCRRGPVRPAPPGFRRRSAMFLGAMAGTRTKWQRHPVEAAVDADAGRCPQPWPLRSRVVRRFVARPVRWSLAVAARRPDRPRRPRVRSTGSTRPTTVTTADATVVDLVLADADDEVELAVSPTLGEVEAEATVRSAPRPAPGSAVSIDVDPDDPDEVALAGDRPTAVPLFGWLFLAVSCCSSPSRGATTRCTAPGVLLLMDRGCRCRRRCSGGGAGGSGSSTCSCLMPRPAPGSTRTVPVVGDGIADLPEGGPPLRVSARSDGGTRGRLVARIDDRLLLPHRRPRRRVDPLAVLPMPSAVTPLLKPSLVSRGAAGARARGRAGRDARHPAQLAFDRRPGGPRHSRRGRRSSGSTTTRSSFATTCRATRRTPSSPTPTSTPRTSGAAATPTRPSSTPTTPPGSDSWRPPTTRSTS